MAKNGDNYRQWKLDLEQLFSEAKKQGVVLDLSTPYTDIPGFCKFVKLDEIQMHGYVLTPGRHLGAEEVEDDGEPFEQMIKRLTATLQEHLAQSAKLGKAIKTNLGRLMNT